MLLFCWQYSKLFVLGAIKHMQTVSGHMFSEDNDCTYPLSICDVDVSFLFSKVFHYLLMAFFHCHVQRSPLIERRIHISKQVSDQISQHDLFPTLTALKRNACCLLHPYVHYFQNFLEKSITNSVTQNACNHALSSLCERCLGPTTLFVDDKKRVTIALSFSLVKIIHACTCKCYNT